jgi:hypothetical protein
MIVSLTDSHVGSSSQVSPKNLASLVPQGRLLYSLPNPDRTVGLPAK